MIVFTLLVVLLGGDGCVSSHTMQFPTLEACMAARDEFAEYVEKDARIADDGRICVQSDFNPNRKPHA